MRNKRFNSIYRAVFKNVLHLHFIVHLYTAAAEDAIITLKAVSENVRTDKVRNCILFLSVEKRINSVCILKQNTARLPLLLALLLAVAVETPPVTR